MTHTAFYLCKNKTLPLYLMCLCVLLSVCICIQQGAACWAGTPSGCVAFPNTRQPEIGPGIQEGHQETDGLLYHTWEACEQPVSFCRWTCFVLLLPIWKLCSPGYETIIHIKDSPSVLCCFRYQNLETFIIDVNLVFDNCEKFNEDNSEIGRAGHNMRKFFEKRWTELLKQTN